MTAPEALAGVVVETGPSPLPVIVTETSCVAVRPVWSVTVAVKVSVAAWPSASAVTADPAT